jgi:L-ascorbate metabolism protein UlaG (beta-lactamase superfamily)
MEIIWYGHSCFRLRDKNVTVVTDPYEKSPGLILPKLRADVVTISHDHPGHNCIEDVKGEPIVLSCPGEYEIKGIFITGIASVDTRRQDFQRENTIFVFEMEDLNICHLGDIGHIPGQEQVEALGDVHVLLTPVGGANSLTASQAAEIISLLEPRVVVPMHYGIPELQTGLDPVSKLFKEMGLKEPPPQDSLRITTGTLPEETQVVLLEYKQ